MRPIVSLSALYSPSKGIGIGGGIALDSLFRRGDRAQIEARLAQHLLGGIVEYRSAMPGTERTGVLLGASAWTTDRTGFRGHGPHSPEDTRLFLERTHAEAEARLIFSPAPSRRLIIQPTARFRYDYLRDFEEDGDGSLKEAAPSDIDRLDAIRGARRYGVEAALSVIRDALDRPFRPRRGTYMQGEVARFRGLDGSDLGFTRAEVNLLAFSPIALGQRGEGRRATLFVRGFGLITRQDENTALPWIYLTEFARDKFVGYPHSAFAGRDALSFVVGARRTVYQRSIVGRSVDFEGIAMVMLGAAYDDVFREFTFRVRTDAAAPPPGEVVPLTPSLGVGVDAYLSGSNRPLVGGILGVGPGGITVTSLRFVVGLDRYRPRLR